MKNKMEKKMENKKIDFVVYESTMNRLERVNKRLFIENIVLIVIIFLIIGGILAYSMLPSESIEASQKVSDVDNSNVTNVGK